MSALLQVRNLAVRFGGVQALQDINFDVPEKGIYGIIGPNGAGKTTLFNCMSGFVRPIPGSSIRFCGDELVGKTVHEIARLGIARTFQGIALNRSKTVLENLMAGFHQRLDYGAWEAFFPGKRVREGEERAQRTVEQTLDLLKLPKPIQQLPVEILSLGMQKKVEVARALMAGPRVILLDEPGGGLNAAETADLRASLEDLQRTTELSIVLVDHDMRLVMPLCDKILVVSFGQRIAEGTPEHVRRDPAVITSYLGGGDDA
jgi:branched-chain amino acid transport system ATP-binding protein